MNYVKVTYLLRFSENELKQMNQIWKVLCDCFFQKYIGKDDSVLDLGAGYGQFINNIRCGKKYALDINENTKMYVNKNIEVFISNCTEMKEIRSGSLNVVFASNLFEHLKSKQEILKTLQEIYRVLN